jgi:hypothetical protein
MSQIEVDKVIPQSGTSLQLGENGDTISVPAGATFDASSGTFTLPDGSVVEAKIASNAVTTAKINNSAVTNDKLAGSIANSKLANSAITINGSAVSLGGSTTIATGISWQSSIKNANFNAAANEAYWVNTTSNTVTATLPGSASVGDRIVFVDASRTFNSNSFFINQNSLKFQSNTTPNPEYSIIGTVVDIVYSGTTYGWTPVEDQGTTDKTGIAVIDYLVVAGGGGGGGTIGGGGGAGGMVSATSVQIDRGITYTITVGSGQTSSTQGDTGGVSSIAGSGLPGGTTISTVGGGNGGNHDVGNNAAGTNGGSGGGGGANASSGTNQGGNGTSGQGNNGGSANNDNHGGGGGGKGAVGASSTGSPANGGTGAANSITGSSVTYAGGGAGGSRQGYSTATGGSGGGGNGGNYPQGNGGNGTDGLGGGGGGPNGNGGDGVVILRLLASVYSGTTTGSPTVTDDGSYKVIKFTGSGSYTA